MDYNVSVTFICSGKPKDGVTCFIAIFILMQQSGTESAIFPRYACIMYVLLTGLYFDQNVILYFCRCIFQYASFVAIVTLMPPKISCN